MIKINNTWDLSARIMMYDVNNNPTNSTIIGRFNPNTATGEQIQTLMVGLTSLTRNTYVDTSLSAKKSLNQYIAEEEEEENG